MLIEQLKAANIAALKARDKEARAILSVVINKYSLLSIELSSKGKEIGDADLIGIIQKTLKELEDEKNSFLSVNNLERVEAATYQMNIIKVYLPKMLSEEEIRNEILNLENRSIPSVMKHFKEKFLGKA